MLPNVADRKKMKFFEPALTDHEIEHHRSRGKYSRHVVFLTSSRQKVSDFGSDTIIGAAGGGIGDLGREELVGGKAGGLSGSLQDGGEGLRQHAGAGNNRVQYIER